MDTFTPRLDILPGAQRLLWQRLRPIQQFGYVLYGGTAIALRLGHRQSVDFDFFNSNSVDPGALRAALPFLRNATVRQERPNTYEIETASGVIPAQGTTDHGTTDYGTTGRRDHGTNGPRTTGPRNGAVFPPASLRGYARECGSKREGWNRNFRLVPVFSPIGTVACSLSS
jgi:hypothetical protein